MIRPKRRIIPPATHLRESAGTPNRDTRAERLKVKKVKLRMNPVTTPHGRAFPLPVEPARTTGSKGKIQGERMVTTPARKAKIINRIMVTGLL